MTVAVLGPEGTFSHELGTHLYGSDIELVPTIRAIFERVERGECDGLVPLENSLAGGVGATLDGLRDFGVFITGEAYMEIKHHLVGFVPESRLEVLYTHPQTHEQCSEFIDRLGCEVVHTPSNGASARECRLHKPTAGAITSGSAARFYQIPIIRSDVQNRSLNVTRFVRISPHRAQQEGLDKCSILIDPASDRAGLLFDLLGVFARRAINLTRIESRPDKSGIGSYVFYVDFEMQEGWRDAIDELKSMACIKEFGCYRTCGVDEWM